MAPGTLHVVSGLIRAAPLTQAATMAAPASTSDKETPSLRVCALASEPAPNISVGRPSSRW
jgi:hypothetical protein